MDGASGAVYLCLSCGVSFDCARGLNVHKSKKHGLVVSESRVFAGPSTHSRKRKVSHQVVVQTYGADASVSSGDEMGPTSVHEETGAGVETEYTADDYEFPAGERHIIYYDCNWSD